MRETIASVDTQRIAYLLGGVKSVANLAACFMLRIYGRRRPRKDDGRSELLRFLKPASVRY